MADLVLNYDPIAVEYNQRYPAQQPTQRGLVLLDLAKQIKAENILEVGSGAGFWLNLLYQVSNELYGLDYSAGISVTKQSSSRSCGSTISSRCALLQEQITKQPGRC